MRHLTPAVALLVTLVIACSGDPEPIPIEKYCARFTEYACSTADTCKCLTGAERTFCSGFVQADCQDSTEKDVKAGTKTWDAKAAGQCLADLAKITQDCSFDSDEYPKACETMLAGALAAGAKCSGSDECLSGLECVADRCTALPTDGKPCADSRCARDLFCGADKVCHAPRGPAGTCEEGSVACRTGLFCDSTTRSCQPQRADGGACTESSACGASLYCSSASKTCRPYPGAGGDCDDSSGRCADGFSCSDTTHTCQALKPTGASCASGRECASGECKTTCTAPNACPFL